MHALPKSWQGQHNARPLAVARCFHARQPTNQPKASARYLCTPSTSLPPVSTRCVFSKCLFHSCPPTGTCVGGTQGQPFSMLQAHAAMRRGQLQTRAQQPMTPGSTGAGSTGPAPSGARLDMQHMAMIQAAWRQFLPPTAVEQNKLLSRMMQQAAQGDPYAYTIFKQDGKDFMTGVIPAVEFRDRFISIFRGYAGAELLFLQMALLVPNPAKRLQLLQLAPNPWLLPAAPLEGLPPSSPPAAPQQPPPAPAGTAPRVVQTAPSSGQPTAKAALPMAAATAADAAANQEDKEGEEYEEDEEFEEDEDYDPAAYEDEEEGEEDEGQGVGRAGGQDERYTPQAKDFKEMRGWQVLDRAHIRSIMVQMGLDTTPPTDQQPGSAGSDPPAADPAATASTLMAVMPGVKLDEGIHINSLTTRPAKKLAGKKATAAVPQVQAPEGSRNALVWLRQDLRLHDNPALVDACYHAAAAGGTVTFVYVHSPEEDGEDWSSGSRWRPGSATLFWLQQALQSLDATLQQRYGAEAAIVYKRGPYVSALTEVASAVDAWHVFYGRRYEPAMSITDQAVATALGAAGVQVHTYPGHLLQEPWKVKVDMSSWSGHFGTLMPFYRAWCKLPSSGSPLKEPKSVPVAKESPASKAGGLQLSELGLYTPPRSSSGQPINWAAPIDAAWDISEAAALKLLDDLLSASGGLRRYEAQRSYADGRAVSHLSPYLRNGQLSVRLMWQRLRQAKAEALSKTFYRRLVWRDLAYWQLHHWPDMATEPIRGHYMDMEWAGGPAAAAQLKAWQRGQTGFPLVDSGMRELWQTGWMQQSVRMVCAAFLTEYLNLPWQEGARWFHDTLVDADAAINAMMWQNAGKSGLDQWNFTLLPTSKGQDPTGAYIKRWVPELAQLPSSHIHAPWSAPPATLAAAGVALGSTYPHRIVTEDLVQLRARNVAAIREARRLHLQEWSDSRGYDLVVVPKGATVKHDGTKVVVFTKQEYRSVDGPIPSWGRAARATTAAEEDEHETGEAEVADDGGIHTAAAAATEAAAAVPRKRQRKGSNSSSAGGKGGPRAAGPKGRSRMTFKDWQQRTLDEYAVRSN